MTDPERDVVEWLTDFKALTTFKMRIDAVAEITRLRTALAASAAQSGGATCQNTACPGMTLCAECEHLHPKATSPAETDSGATPLDPGQAGTRYRHVKRGTEYTIRFTANAQCDEPIQDYDCVVVYQDDASGAAWARPSGEFFDGRFERIADENPAPSAASVRAEDERDAARYRYLREHLSYADWTDEDGNDVVIVHDGHELDAPIDRALQTPHASQEGRADV